MLKSPFKKMTTETLLLKRRLRIKLCVILDHQELMIVP